VIGLHPEETLTSRVWPSKFVARRSTCRAESSFWHLRAGHEAERPLQFGLRSRDVDFDGQGVAYVGRGDLENPLLDAVQRQAVACGVHRHSARDIDELVGEGCEEQCDHVFGLADLSLAAWGSITVALSTAEQRRDDAIQFANAGIGRAAAAVGLEDGLRGRLGPGEVGGQVEGVEQRLAATGVSLDEDGDDTDHGSPSVDSVPELAGRVAECFNGGGVSPRVWKRLRFPVLDGTVQGRIAAEPGHEAAPPLRRPGEQEIVVRVPRIDADEQLVAVLRQGQDDGSEKAPDVLSYVLAAGRQHEPSDVASIGDRDEQPVVLHAVRPVVGETTLPAVDLVRERVHVDNDAAATAMMLANALPPYRQESLRQRAAVVRAVQYHNPARPDRLRGRPVSVSRRLRRSERAVATTTRHRHVERRVVTQYVDVIVDLPALWHQKHTRQDEFMERVRDAVQRAVVDQLCHHAPQFQAIRDVTHWHRASVRGHRRRQRRRVHPALSVECRSEAGTMLLTHSRLAGERCRLREHSVSRASQLRGYGASNGGRVWRDEYRDDASEIFSETAKSGTTGVDVAVVTTVSPRVCVHCGLQVANESGSGIEQCNATPCVEPKEW